MTTYTEFGSGLGPRRADAVGSIEEKLLPLRAQLVAHPVYERLATIDALRTFLRYHAFAVWDFMSLLRALQQRICGARIPWVPPANIVAARMINEMMLVEETDELPDHSSYGSHFELFQRGLREAGVTDDEITPFVRAIADGAPAGAAFDAVGAPPAARAFVTASLAACADPDTHRLAAYFVFGRENIIPSMFRNIVTMLESRFGASFPTLRYYLERHIGIDETEHGPASRRMLAALCGDDERLWAEALESAREALLARLALWDATVAAIDAQARGEV